MGEQYNQQLSNETYGSPADYEGILNFFARLYQANRTLRFQGDASEFMPPDFRESVAEHTYQLLLTCFLLLQQNPNFANYVDKDQLSGYVLFHDIGELGFNGRDWTITDIVNGHVTLVDKNAQEAANVEKITSGLPDDLREEINFYHQEFEQPDDSNLAGLFARYMDAFQGVLTVSLYGDLGNIDCIKGLKYTRDNKISPLAANIEKILLNTEDMNAITEFAKIHSIMLRLCEQG